MTSLVISTRSTDGYLCSLGRMTCWTWRPCFRRTPDWDARSFSPESSKAWSSPYPKSPGTSTWTGTRPNLTEKRFAEDDDEEEEEEKKKREGVSATPPRVTTKRCTTVDKVRSNSRQVWKIPKLANDRTRLQIEIRPSDTKWSEINGYFKKQTTVMVQQTVYLFMWSVLRQSTHTVLC